MGHPRPEKLQTLGSVINHRQKEGAQAKARTHRWGITHQKDLPSRSRNMLVEVLLALAWPLFLCALPFGRIMPVNPFRSGGANHPAWPGVVLSRRKQERTSANWGIGTPALRPSPSSRTSFQGAGLERLPASSACGLSLVSQLRALRTWSRYLPRPGPGRRPCAPPVRSSRTP